VTRFEKLPIRKKLTLLILVTSAATALLCTMCGIVYEVIRFRENFINDAVTQTDIVSINSASALAFDDAKAAQEILDGLRYRPGVDQACLYKPNGTLLAEYDRFDQFAPPVPRLPGHRFDRGHFLTFQQVKLGQDVVGTIALRMSLHELYLRIVSGAGFVIAIILAALSLSFFLSAKLEPLVSNPILELARLADDVALKKDYSLRAPKRSEDEIGLLADRFNAMLGQIQQSSAALRENELRFRQLAENITEVFWMTNPAKTEMLYISPGYETIWGRSCQSLYESPQTWMNAIHPEDRDRVKQAALSKQTEGEFDEEYRVVRPDGTFRWIRDRAFPIRDAAGQIYRLAGIAEDITERKRLRHQLLDTSDREQRRISHDLHDGLGQQLVGAAMLADGLAHDLASHQLPQAAQASKVSDLIRQSVEQVRALVHGLTPSQLDGGNLPSALRALANNIETQCGVTCAFHCSDTVEIEDDSIGTHLYRITQEAINNALRHGKARHLRIQLEANSEHGRLTITDDGHGLSDNYRHGEGMGLHIMAERAQIIGGTFEITGAPVGGTMVTCTFKTTTTQQET